MSPIFRDFLISYSQIHCHCKSTIILKFWFMSPMLWNFIDITITITHCSGISIRILYRRIMFPVIGHVTSPAGIVHRYSISAIISEQWIMFPIVWDIIPIQNQKHCYSQSIFVVSKKFITFLEFFWDNFLINIVLHYYKIKKSKGK